MKIVDLFRLPVFSFKFKDHQKYKSQWIKTFENDNLWLERKKDISFDVTIPNLHKVENFNPLRVFFLECLYEVMSECGMHIDVGLTSMWSTKHKSSDYHHSHTHGNAFFVGCYYFDSDSKTPSGTVFNNVMADFYQFNRITKPVPSRNNLSHSFHYEYEETFEEGKLIIFPAWLRHTTRENDGEFRQIIGFNSMPIGQSSNCKFDRYYYQDFRDKLMNGDNY